MTKEEWNDPMLGEIVANLEGQLTPENKPNYEKLVVAGMKAVLHKGPGGILYALDRRPDVVITIVRGAINLVGVLKSISKNPPQPAAMVPAAFTLMMRGLDFAGRAKLIDITPEVIGQAQRLFMNNIMTAFGVQPRQLGRMSEMVEQTMRDPVKMDQIERYVGYTKDPRIPVKTLDDKPVNEAEATNGV